MKPSKNKKTKKSKDKTNKNKTYTKAKIKQVWKEYNNFLIDFFRKYLYLYRS